MDTLLDLQGIDEPQIVSASTQPVASDPAECAQQQIKLQTTVNEVRNKMFEAEEVCLNCSKHFETAQMLVTTLVDQRIKTSKLLSVSDIQLLNERIELARKARDVSERVASDKHRIQNEITVMENRAAYLVALKQLHDATHTSSTEDKDTVELDWIHEQIIEIKRQIAWAQRLAEVVPLTAHLEMKPWTVYLKLLDQKHQIMKSKPSPPTVLDDAFAAAAREAARAALLETQAQLPTATVEVKRAVVAASQHQKAWRALQADVEATRASLRQFRQSYPLTARGLRFGLTPHSAELLRIKVQLWGEHDRAVVALRQYRTPLQEAKAELLRLSAAKSALLQQCEEQTQEFLLTTEEVQAFRRAQARDAVEQEQKMRRDETEKYAFGWRHSMERANYKKHAATAQSQLEQAKAARRKLQSNNSSSGSATPVTNPRMSAYRPLRVDPFASAAKAAGASDAASKGASGASSFSSLTALVRSQTPSGRRSRTPTTAASTSAASSTFGLRRTVSHACIATPGCGTDAEEEDDVCGGAGVASQSDDGNIDIDDEYAVAGEPSGGICLVRRQTIH